RNLGGSPLGEGPTPVAEADAQTVKAVQDSAHRALDVFATAGLQGVTQFLEANVPEEELRRAADVVIRLLTGAMSDLRALAGEEAGMAPLSANRDDVQRDDTWLRLSLAALSDLSFYPAPVFFMLSDCDRVEASVFQLNRSPGKGAV